MTERKDKRFCVVDHADKEGERRAKNPNRLKLTRERYARWIGAEKGQEATGDKDRGP